MSITNEIFPIPEIEDMILAYIDPIDDLPKLSRVNHYYNSVAKRNTLYTTTLNYHIRYGRISIHDIFTLICSQNNISGAKYLKARYLNYLRSYSYDDIYIICCRNGHLDTAVFLLNSGFNISRIKIKFIFGTYDCNSIFTDCCKHIYMFIWMYNMYIMDDYVNLLFKQACTDGNITAASFLYNLIEFYGIGNYTTNDLFQQICKKNHLGIAIWLYNLDDSKGIIVDIHHGHDQALCTSGWSNSYDIVDWLCCLDYRYYEKELLKNIPDVSYQLQYYHQICSPDKFPINYELVFMNSCEFCKLEIAILIYNYMDRSTVVYKDNRQLIHRICARDDANMLLWLLNI